MSQWGRWVGTELARCPAALSRVGGRVWLVGAELQMAPHLHTTMWAGQEGLGHRIILDL